LSATLRMLKQMTYQIMY